MGGVAVNASSRPPENEETSMKEQVRLIYSSYGKVIATLNLTTGQLDIFRGANHENMMRGLGGYSAWQFAEREEREGRDTLIRKLQIIADDAPLSVKYEIADKYSDVSAGTIIGEVFSYASGYSDSKAYEELLMSDDGRQWYSRYWQAVKEAWMEFAASRGMSLGEASDIEELTPYDFVSLLVKNEQGHAQDESEE